VEGVVLLELATIGISGGPQLIEGYVKQVELLLDLALDQFPASQEESFELKEELADEKAK
jgi:hypothetical protein